MAESQNRSSYSNFLIIKIIVVIMNNELPTHIVRGNFSDLKHKINNKWPNRNIGTYKFSVNTWFSLRKKEKHEVDLNFQLSTD